MAAIAAGTLVNSATRTDPGQTACTPNAAPDLRSLSRACSRASLGTGDKVPNFTNVPA